MNNRNKQTSSQKTGLGRGIGFAIVSVGFLALSSATLPSAQAAGAYTNAVLADNPLGYYRVSETSGTTAFDSTTPAENGTYLNGVTLGVPGPRPSAFDGFEGNNTG